MENSYIWAINGCEFEVDMEDADTIDRYLSALKVLENAENRQVSNISEKIFSGISDNSRKYDECLNRCLMSSADSVRNRQAECPEFPDVTHQKDDDKYSV